MIVLGIIDSKPSAAAVTNNGQILAAVAEERLCRKKMATGFPRAAVTEALRIAAVDPSQVDQVAIAQEVSVFQSEPVAWEGWFEDSNPLQPTRLERLASGLAPVFGRLPLAWKAYHVLKGLTSRERNREIPRLLERDYGISAPVAFYDHHYCHATSAYFTSGFAEALIITLDGGGDGLSGTVYTGRSGRLTKLSSVDSFNSLGNFYSYVTALCGFRAEKDEGKLTGLAAVGRPAYADTLRRFIRTDGRGGIRYSVPMYHSSALRRIGAALPRDFDRADLAASVQLVLEEVGTEFIRYWLQRTGLRRLAAAGGVFANVKFNQRVHELEAVDDVFIHPAMDDGGLSWGSALAATIELRPGLASGLSSRLADVRLGPQFGELEVHSAIEESGLQATRESNIHRAIAHRLAAGDVVARFTGRLEYGPRALGARSILYQTTDRSVNDWLNARLQRTEFMPFAPATLSEFADRCYVGLDGARDAARFMTITFDCTEWMSERSPGVVHVDGTARPQIVDESTAPDFHRILMEYHVITGLPSLINTSFNMHEEPIVATPREALTAFLMGRLDWLAMEDFMIAAPAGSVPKTPAEARASATQRPV